MKIINEKGKLFGLVNVIDLIVILFIVGICAIAVAKTSVMKKVNVLENKKPYEIQFFVRSVLPAMAEQIKVNDFVLEDESNSQVGTISDVKVELSKVEVQTADGRVVNATSDARRDILITVKGEGLFDDKKGLILGNKDWQAGGAIVVKTSKVKFGSNIYRINY